MKKMGLALRVLAIMTAVLSLAIYARGYQVSKEAQSSEQQVQSSETPVQVLVQTPAQQKDFYDKASFWVNSALALVGVFGLIAAFKTLRKLERQTLATESAAKTAAKDLSISSRAWVDARVVESIFEVGKPMAVKVVFENSGKTPARKARTLQVAKLINSTPEKITLTYPESNYSQGFSLIMPGGNLTRMGNCLAADNDPPLGMGGILTQHMMDKILAAEIAAVTYGRIEYEDVFGIKHWTSFFFFLRVFKATEKMPEIRGWGCAPTGNDMDNN